ncbi:Retrovirus-related Pol polyprotein from transposon TNT 1-94 [Vitis vinifera]|uniref:Retrovirus-related Pol polyprotein from transposon TNT 1-94 n=1 Tax=Vitis vinifera TaxID=29760 RepID=A0A438H7F4_VITVI|nr:Retrovirus-related Pol polyprotein from transposon TNT 1-94 [Vitis vinifera]
MRASKAKEAWDILQQEFQGDKRTRSIKLQALRRELENMKMKENETLNDFSSRFMGLVNQMKSYGEEISDKRIVEKLLITLPDKFNPIVAVIEETKDLSLLSVQELGYTNHMTGNKNIFLDMDTNINSQVKMGHGDLVNVKGKGTIVIQTKVGTKYIRDVLLIPALEQNLLSVGQLVEHGMEDVEEAWLWHRRFGHLNFNSLKMLCQRKMVQGLPNIIEEKNEVCDGCALGKHHRQSFPKGVAWRAKKVLELIHTDICGPMSTPSQGNNKYFVLFIDDFTRMIWVFFMMQKSEVFSILKKFKSFVEKQGGCYIKTLRSDRGMKYTSSQFGNFCEDEGLRRILEDIKEKQNEATYLLCDNNSAIAIAKNYVFHSRTRHIAVKYHFIKEAISDDEVQLMYCKSEEQIADIFTKACL